VTPKNHHWRHETWWWNDKVDAAINQKCARFKIYKALDKEGKSSEAEEAKSANNEAK
jgi:hypothetical protein